MSQVVDKRYQFAYLQLSGHHLVASHPEDSDDRQVHHQLHYRKDGDNDVGSMNHRITQAFALVFELMCFEVLSYK